MPSAHRTVYIARTHPYNAMGKLFPRYGAQSHQNPDRPRRKAIPDTRMRPDACGTKMSFT
jgi:hypothetical protein